MGPCDLGACGSAEALLGRLCCNPPSPQRPASIILSPPLAQTAVLTGTTTLTRCGVGDKVATALPWVLRYYSRPKGGFFSVSSLGSWDLRELGRVKQIGHIGAVRRVLGYT